MGYDPVMVFLAIARALPVEVFELIQCRQIEAIADGLNKLQKSSQMKGEASCHRKSPPPPVFDDTSLNWSIIPVMSEGIGASIVMRAPVAGWMNEIRQACSI